MAALPYMQLYVADYLADTAHLSTLEHGAYLLLIMTYWQRGKPLPADHRKLARIARLNDDEWGEVADNLSELFREVDGEWKHKRIDKDLAAVEAKSQKARDARAQRTRNERSTDVERPSSHKDTDKDTDTPKEGKRAKRAATKTKAAHKIPDDWSLTEADRNYALGKGIAQGRLEGMAEKFFLNHKGKGNKYANWHLAWCTWVQNDIEWAAQRSTGPPATVSSTQSYRETLAKRRAANGNA